MKAEKIVLQPPPPPPPPVKIALEMTSDEAATLMEVAQYVGGSPTESRRKHVDSLLAALTSVGIQRSRGVRSGYATGIFFEEGSLPQ